MIAKKQMVKELEGINKVYLILLAFCLIITYSSLAKAQNYTGFYGSLSKNLGYPFKQHLNDTCTLIYTNIIIDVSVDGQIGDMKMSDSAPSPLKEKFVSVKNKLDLGPVSSLVKSKKLKNCSILIPILYISSTEQCNYQASVLDNMFSHYSTYEGQPNEKVTYNLDLLKFIVYPPVR